MGYAFHTHVLTTDYLRARLQFQTAQQPRFRKQLPAPLIELLHVAAESHKLALNIESRNADALLCVYYLLQVWVRPY